ncbi:MAG: hypothetical protein AAF591_12860 [Verrucomicrobiota bacterium]
MLPFSNTPAYLCLSPRLAPLASAFRSLPIIPSIVFVALLSATPQTAHAINSADGTSGEWSNPAVWSGNVPTTTDNENDVTLRSGASVTLSSGTAGVFSRIQIGRDGIAGTTTTLTISGGSFHAAGALNSGPNEIGSSTARTGAFVLQNGLASFSVRRVHTAAVPGSTGHLSQSGGTFVCEDHLHIGQNGNSTVTLSGGQMIVGNDTRIASEAGSSASVNITGGIFRSNAFLSGPLIVGRHGSATVTVSGGTILCGPDSSIATRNAGNEGHNLNIGDGNTTATGRLIVQGPKSVVQVGDRLRIGLNASGTGVVEVHGGTLTSDGQFLIAQTAGSRGSLIVTDGFVSSNFDNNGTNFRNITVGNSGNGFLKLTGGTIRVPGRLRIGYNSGAVGTFLMEGGILNAAEGDDGLGRNAEIDIASLEGSQGFARISGGTINYFAPSFVSQGFRVADEGTGHLEFSGNAYLNAQTSFEVGVGTSGNGTFSMDSGQIDCNAFIVGNRGHATATVNGSADINASSSIIVANSLSGNGSLSLGGGASINAPLSLLVGRGDNATATLNIFGTGGAQVSVAGDCTIGDGFDSDAVTNLSGGTLTILGDCNIGSFFQSNAELNYTGGILQLSGSLTLAGPATLHVSPPLAIQAGKGFDPGPGFAFGETIDLTGVTPPAPNPNHVTVQPGSYFFLVVNDRTGASGGEDLTTNAALDPLALAGVPFPPGAMRLSEADFEANNFNPLTQHVFALVEEQVAANIGRVGLRWSIAPDPDPITLAEFAADNSLPNDPGENSDQDDATLLSEFAFNRDPNVADAQTLTPGTGLLGLPVFTVVGTGNSARLRVEYIRRTSTTAPELTYTVQFGNSLDSLTDFAGTETVIPIDLFWERVTVDDPVTAGTERNRFSQVKVTYTP